MLQGRGHPSLICASLAEALMPTQAENEPLDSTADPSKYADVGLSIRLEYSTELGGYMKHCSRGMFRAVY